MNVGVPNLEEAANVAAEFIYSIDNLPSEVAHLLQEIKHRDTRTQELQQEIDKDAAKYIRHSRRASSASTPMPMTTLTSRGTTPSTASTESSSSRTDSPKSTPAPAGTPIPIPAKISASYAEIHELAVEKCALAERLIEIITRTRAKLDVDIAKVRVLQGESPELVAAAAAASNIKPLGMTLGAGSIIGGVGMGLGGFGVPGANPALAISESLRNALAPLAAEGHGRGSISATRAASPATSIGHATKKRRMTTTTSIKISPAATPTKHRSASPSGALGAAAATQQKSRLSRQIHPPVSKDVDMDAEGEEDEGDMEEENEDETLYCFCQKQSYGDMIACDNEGGCPYEWFHLACVGLKQPTPEKWFCSVCTKNKGLTPSATTARKGRKK